ncbi:hypothetical protein COV18_06960 [Candidatus Woesearchaeota archaeon CG10_big_fil_rev_8_21_14_0_10_37_12]|nr:MAG: hypothetical protein COV18_06960 [Candidatus Woesearchaeota archaeon CG10_big_fil_rev_8_21_14_0_10_37_12]
MFFLQSCAELQNDKTNPVFITNENYIKAIRSQINVSDKQEVFSYVWKQLDTNITIYPTEGYYYFTFPINGYMLSGSLSLLVSTRDKGMLGFGYIATDRETKGFPQVLQEFDIRPLSKIGGGKNYNKTDGVFVEKIDDLVYDVTFENKTITFTLHTDPYALPKRTKLLSNEIFVGPVFDESGTKFHLIFNKDISRMYYLLNEDEFIAEEMHQTNTSLIIGKRTAFAYFNDSENNRRILVGVNGENVMENNWFDGPFDQVPDYYNYLGFIPKYKEYVEASFPHTKGKIDKYGFFLDDPSVRVALAPYTVYFYKEDLEFIQECETHNNLTEIYACLTEQIYIVPEEYNYFK